MQRIVISTQMRRQGETGVQAHFNAFASYLSQRGIRYEVATPFQYFRVIAAGVFAVRWLLHRIDCRFSVWWYREGHYFFLRGNLSRIAKAASDDTVFYAQCPLSALAALKARRNPRQKVFMVVHFNGSQADEWVGKGMLTSGDWVFRHIKQQEKAILPQLDGIVYVSAFMRDYIEREIPEARHVPSVVLPNFVFPAPSPTNFNHCADLITIGTLEERKNHAYLLKILAAARNIGHIYHLDVVGDGPLRSYLEHQAKAEGVEDQVRFLGFQPQASQLIPGHRAYVHAARVENFPIALIEALSFGLPVFGPAVGGIPEMFDDKIEGRFWPLDDAQEAAKILIEVLENRGQYEAMQLKANKRFKKQYDAAVVAEYLLGFLTSHAKGA